MLKIKSILAITALCYLSRATDALEVLKKSKEFPGQEVLFSDYSFKDSLLVYAVCEKAESRRTKKCTVIQEVSPYVNVSRSCQVEVASTNEDGKVRDLFVGALNPDTALIVWLEEGSKIVTHIGALNLNKCSIQRGTIDDSEDNSPVVYWQLKNARTIVRFRDFADIFFKLPACSDEKECKIRIDDKGNFVVGAIGAMKRLPHYVEQISSINTSSPLQGYAYKRYNEKDASYFVQIPLGLVNAEKQLATSPEAMLYDIVSTSNNKINIYFKGIGPGGSSNGNMTLLQFDTEGNNVLTTDLPDISNSTQVLNIYNLPEGGSILLLADVEDGTGCSKLKGFSLVKIDASGKKIGEIQIQGPDSGNFYEIPTDRHRRYIWKNKQGGYCATIVGPTTKCTLVEVTQEDDLQIIENCFTDADFKQ